MLEFFSYGLGKSTEEIPLQLVCIIEALISKAVPHDIWQAQICPIQVMTSCMTKSVKTNAANSGFAARVMIPPSEVITLGFSKGLFLNVYQRVT